MGERNDIIFAQADLFALPFRPATFDFIVSWGVLHHTPSTRAAFERLVPLVKPGGTLFVMVYEQGSRLREAGTNALRKVMRLLPDERRYRACRYLILRPTFAGLLSPFLIVAHAPMDPAQIRTIQFGLFDAYSPRWNHLHTTEEVASWFRDAEFDDITPLSSPGAVRVSGRKRDKRINA